MELKFINFKNFMFKNSYLWYIWRAIVFRYDIMMAVTLGASFEPPPVLAGPCTQWRVWYKLDLFRVGWGWPGPLLFPATFSVQFILIIKIKFVITWLHGELNIDTLRMWEWWGNKGGTAEWLQLQSSNQLFKNVLENQWMGQEQDI